MVTETDLKMKIQEVLETVTDPEIPAVSVVDLGIIKGIHIDSDSVYIKALPTFLGCPALDMIRENIKLAVEKIEGVHEVIVEFVYDHPWTSDRITAEGREKLKKFGIAPPPVFEEETSKWSVDCPYCGSAYTTMENLFGPTACRSILYCKSCKNPFEAMKPVSTL